MIQSNSRTNTETPLRVIAADMPILTKRYPIEQLLDSFHKLSRVDDGVRLVLAGRRCPEEIYCVWNYIDRHGLTELVEFHPYYDRCQAFPIKKPACDVWISRNTPPSLITPDYLRKRLDGTLPGERKYAMFFTSFHPEKKEGNSTLMRLWLDHMKRAGYITHLVYYMYDTLHNPGAVSAEMRRSALYQFDLYREIPVKSKLTGANYNGLNVHVDDWCGVEAIEAVEKLASEYEYDIAVTNYPFMSAIFDRISAYTEKILLTHDSFVDRNRRMLEQGYPESGWISIDKRGEQLACDRSDIIVAMQEHEADGFRAISDPKKVRVVSPIFEKIDIEHPAPAPKLRIGYFGSSNWVNEQNLGEYLKGWANDPELSAHTEILIAGSVCETLHDFVPRSLLDKVNPTMLGRVDEPGDFFSRCDVVINPERGGTGIKIKTLEALAHSMPVMTTKGGSIGIGSENPYHLAEGFEALVTITKQLINSPDELEKLRTDCIAVYDTYCALQSQRMNDLLGKPIDTQEEPDTIDESISVIAEHKPAPRSKKKLQVPDYVRQTASDYHFEEFERFVERVDVRGRRVLEIGSDFHLATARLFMANGAESVVATNIGNWKSDEPMPDGVEFKVCDASDADLPERSFDIIYGIAIIEHVPDFQKLCDALKRFLKPDGVIYFQGCPLWAGTLGHHVWFASEPALDQDDQDAQAESIQYSFTNNNPIPNWAHLALSPDELETLLVEQDIPEAHAKGIVNYVHNIDGKMIGSCSNFYSASEVLDVMENTFDVEVERITSDIKPNKYFKIARERYAELDLRTLGLRVWMSHKGAAKERACLQQSPKVSIVIPFYKVDEFIEDCIKSVLKQDYTNIEIIFVDDDSPDESRKIVEKYASKDDRIKLIIHEHNQGLGPARNTGVEHSTGAYLLFLDSDDYFATPNAISTLVHEAKSTGCRVVIGSCDRIMTNGQRLDFDRGYDQSHNGHPDTVVCGEQAYLGASFIPGGEYVPMRAWGTLIDRFLYLESGLTYPPAEHEDLPHTPFLYHYAGRVLYISDIVITYRDRSDSISNTGWSGAKIRRQGMIWVNIRENIIKFGLEKHLGDTAVKTAEHLIMKLRQNGIQAGSEEAAFDVLEEILSDAQGDLNEELFFYMLDSLRGILDFQKYDYNLYHKLTGQISTANMVKYYRHRIGSGMKDHGPVPVNATADERQPPVPVADDRIIEQKAVSARVTPALFTLNDTRAKALIDRFWKKAPKKLVDFPSMLTDGDKALYFDAGKNFQFRGSIVDAGCFVGGTTMSLVQGLRQNPLYKENTALLNKLIRVYDLFEIHDDYILEHLQRNYPKHDFSDEQSFLPIFKQNMLKYGDMLDVRPGDVIESGYPDEAPIEVLGIDLCKALPVTDFVVREFFPRLIDGALVIHQDFIHQYHPHIHLSMMMLEEYFDLDIEIRWGGSLSYKLVKPITPEVIESKFGNDSSWYNDIDRNVALLRRLEEQMLYDENKWVIMQVLGIYYWAMKEQGKAEAVYRQTCERFPQFELPDNEVRRLIGGELVK